jgi:hypothetical protein
MLKMRTLRLSDGKKKSPKVMNISSSARLLDLKARVISTRKEEFKK